jgi:hypothetical protein
LHRVIAIFIVANYFDADTAFASFFSTISPIAIANLRPPTRDPNIGIEHIRRES